jgi:hypothetical protein
MDVLVLSLDDHRLTDHERQVLGVIAARLAAGAVVSLPFAMPAVGLVERCRRALLATHRGC